MVSSDDQMPIASLEHYPHRDGAANVLLLAPDGTPPDTHACRYLLDDTDGEPKNVLSLGYSMPSDRTAQAVRWAANDSSAQTAFVCVGERTRSAAASASPSTPSDQLPGTTTVRAVPDPTDLARIGVEVNECLEEWADSENRTMICYHSLTALLSHVELQSAFRFLHVLTGRIAAADAYAHFHLDPDAHGGKAVRTISQLFDEVATVDSDVGSEQ